MFSLSTKSPSDNYVKQKIILLNLSNEVEQSALLAVLMQPCELCFLSKQRLKE